MALTILNNIAAIAAENQLNVTSSHLQSTLEQLSSGSRINSGADDPAGLAIANGLQANIAALTQSSSNATDGIGELQVADGAMSQVTTLLDRAITLATESATATVSNNQRTSLDAEYQSIKAEIDSIGSTTNYNGGQVFTNNTLNVFLSDGSTSGSSTIGVATNTLSSTSLGLGGTQAVATLAQQVATLAAAATATLNGGAFVGSTQANATLTGGAFAGIKTAAATLDATGGLTAGALATGQLTMTVAPVATQSLVIGNQTYTFTAGAPGAGVNDIFIGASIAISTANIVNAINGNYADVAGTVSPGGYGTGTVANPLVTAVDAGGGVINFTAKVNGTAGFAATSTGVGSTNLTWSNSAGANGTQGSTVTVGTQTYTDVAALSTNTGGTAYEILAGSLQNTLNNLQDAVNHTSVHGAIGTNYSLGTLINTVALAGTAGATSLGFTSLVNGSGTIGAGTGNFIATSVGGGMGSFGSATFTGGANADTVAVGGQTYTFVATQGQLNAANTVWVGANEAAALANLAAAVNNGTAGNFNTGTGSGIAGVYGAGTVLNASATAVSGATTATFTAKVNGSGGNVLASTVGGGAAGAGAGGFANATFLNGSNGGTVTIGGQTYNFVTNLSDNSSGNTANEVLVAGNETTTLVNLADAVNNGTTLNSGVGAGSTYSTGTTLNTSATAASNATTATFTAKTAGVAGNLIASTLTGGVGSFTQTGGTTFSGGAAAISAGGVASAGDTITVGTQTYNFVTALTGVANQVLVGASNNASLQNLVAAVNRTDANNVTLTGAGYQYSAKTTANTAATATYVPAANPANPGSVTFTAIAGGVGTLATGTGNFIATTSTGGDNTFMTIASAAAPVSVATTTLTGGGATTNDLLSSANATAALTLINNSVATVAGLRGNLGATVNRLQSASSVINNQTQNLTAAENDVTAADIPTAVAKLSQYSILMQTGISALAQANQQQQLVLKLLQ